MNNDSKKFIYTYKPLSENERRTVESIRSQYDENSDCRNKLTRLQTLDKKAKGIPKSLSITIGVVGVLVFGLGMSMALVWNLIVGGAFVCVVGGLTMLAAYPINKWLLKLAKNKYGKEIIDLSNELLQQ